MPALLGVAVGVGVGVGFGFGVSANWWSTSETLSSSPSTAILTEYNAVSGEASRTATSTMDSMQITSTAAAAKAGPGAQFQLNQGLRWGAG